MGGKIIYQSDEKIFPKEIEEMVREIYALANNRSMDHVVECGDDDFAMALPGVSPFPCQCIPQRGSLAAIIRVITFDLPDFHNLNIPAGGDRYFPHDQGVCSGNRTGGQW